MSQGAGAGTTRIRGRGNAEQRSHVWGCDTGAGEARRPPALARLRGQIPEGALFPPSDEPTLARRCDQGECAQKATRDAVRHSADGRDCRRRFGRGSWKTQRHRAKWLAGLRRLKDAPV
jgi:hypothetical protein